MSVEVELDNRQPLPYLLQSLERLVELLACVLGGHNGPDTGLAFCNCGKRDASCHHALVEQLARELHRELPVSDNHRRDRSLACRSILSTDVEAETAEFLFEIASILPEPL